MKKDYRIRITLDYEPTLSSYPPSVTTKGQAMQFDVDEVLKGTMSDVELVDFGDCLDYEVVEVETV